VTGVRVRDSAASNAPGGKGAYGGCGIGTGTSEGVVASPLHRRAVQQTERRHEMRLQLILRDVAMVASSIFWTELSSWLVLAGVIPASESCS
jgi:hypothetical protein